MSTRERKKEKKEIFFFALLALSFSVGKGPLAILTCLKDFDKDLVIAISRTWS